ncbi:MAG: type I 3-dehydroquinate dehydratase [Eubacteriaceae bacterium]|nr:type I 3-dehydroquinate dehydratase [Eubacteriaceae bacterium]
MDKSIKVRNTIIGGEKTLVTVSILGSTIKDIFLRCEGALRKKPDLLEIRLDKIIDTERELIASMLCSIRKIAEELPIIATYRSVKEGGWGNLPEKAIFEIYDEIIEEGDIDLLDIEMSMTRRYIEQIKKKCKEKGIKLIFSHHNFEDTPDENEILSILKEGERMGADISKIALMPNSGKDVLMLLNAAYKAETELRIPYITISMGNRGKISRIGAGLFGSAITIASWDEKTTAPGQIEILELREILEVLNS